MLTTGQGAGALQHCTETGRCSSADAVEPHCSTVRRRDGVALLTQWSCAAALYGDGTNLGDIHGFIFWYVSLVFYTPSLSSRPVWQVSRTLPEKSAHCLAALCLSNAAVEAKGETDRLSVEELRATVSKAELERVTAKHAPSQTAAFWIQEGEMHKTELEVGQQLRLKTKGDGPFVFSLARLGDEKAGASWTDKIMANKPDSRAAAKPAAQGDAAEENEWVRRGRKQSCS
ncbi:arpin-like [Acipenser ruthenus]|uniref:arpin-like n=1 Tax=Acipenser ruthenus TaxID=7906 RepID=UPI00145A08E5|nr:arpin-like [Acipenser ruthenus]